MKIYVASSWRNTYQPEVVKRLREAGHTVYDFRHPKEGVKGFAWSDIDQDWLKWSSEQYITALNHPIAQLGYSNDFNAMAECDACVMVLPCGRSANAEMGWFAGRGKLTLILQPEKQEPELMYKMADKICLSTEEVIQVLKQNEFSI